MSAAQTCERPDASRANAEGSTENASIIADADKATATIIARLALEGHVVQRGRSGDFTASRWGLSCYCQDVAALQAFARLVGVRDASE